MQLTNIKAGDIIRVDKKGRVFLAEVTQKEKHHLRFEPLSSGITWHEASAREVVCHYKKMKNGVG